MRRKLRIGILSTANIGMQKVTPAMQKGEYTMVVAIASRSQAAADAAAAKLGIPRAHGSYEALLADPEVDAIYNPLPNHGHVPWSIAAIKAGKHVLCEKPLALTTAEAQTLLDVSRAHPHIKVMEAFMYRHHPQWQKAKSLVNSGAIGALRSIHSHFSYFNNDPGNVRNMKDIGGGGLMDIGCYNLSLSRFLFGREPERVSAIADIDPAFGTDRLVSGLLDFGGGSSATFTCSMQIASYQRMHAFGTEGHIEIEIPFNAPPDALTRLWHTRAGKTQEIVFPVCDQYTIQGDLFAQAVLDNTPVPTPLDDGVANMRLIERVFESARSQRWT